ncbi:MAG: glycosyltransferase family 4 protein, partial [Microcystaceae cyanobacterium]
FQQPYFLFVGTLEPRKNLVNLITAFNLFKTTQNSAHQLILIGQLGWQYEAILMAIQDSPFRSDIYQLHYLSNALVAWFYQHAEALVYPSFYEVFGLPLVEAMTLGCPVITSNRSSLPEVAGEAALLINPDRPQEITQAMVQFTRDRPLREHLVQRGLARAKQFSWENTARLTLAVYQALAQKTLRPSPTD